MEFDIKLFLLIASLPRLSFFEDSITGKTAIVFIPELIISSISLSALSIPNLKIFGIESICSLSSKFSLINIG